MGSNTAYHYGDLSGFEPGCWTFDPNEAIAMIRRVAGALLVGGLLQTGAFGQTAPSPAAQPADTPPPVPTAAASSAPTTGAQTQPRSFREPIPTDPTHPNYHAGAHKSIVRHNPLPQRTSYQSNYPYQGGNGGGAGTSSSNNHGGNYSTGGVGRIAEYYDNRTLAPQPDYHPVPVAGFGNGGVPDRNEQIQAQQAGAQRTANIQNNINAYGRPYGAIGAGLGYGLGLGGAGLYTYPY